MRKRIRITIMVFTMLFGLFGCNEKALEIVTSVETMTLTLRGMRGGHVYKFESEDDTTELRRYREVYRNGEDELVLEASAPCGAETMIELMNTCGILRWDGFHGKHPKNVSDGIMFRFEAAVNGGQTVKAEGSENFPKGYRDFVRALDAMLAPTDSPPSRRCSPAGAPAKNDSYVTDISRNLPARNHSDFPALGLETTPLPNTPISANAVWKCHTCGTVNSGMFCAECGMPCRQTSH